MGLVNGLQTGFKKLGEAAGQAIDETRIQMELMGARRRKDGAARDLGYLVYRVSQGATAQPGEQDKLVQRMAEIEKQIEKLEADSRQLRAEGKKPDAPPPQASEPPPPAGTPSPAPEAPSGTAGASETP